MLAIKLILLETKLLHRYDIEAIPLLREKEPAAEIVMYTVIDDYTTIFQAICNGATGYLIKDQPLDILEKQIESIITGQGALLSPVIAKRIISYFNKNLEPEKIMNAEEYNLSSKEAVVVTLLRDGMTYERIANYMGCTLNGVRYYVKNVYRKMQVRSKGELTRKLQNS